MRSRLTPLAFFAVAACSSSEGRNHHQVFEQRTQAKSYADVPFDIETVTFFRTTDTLPELDVRSLALANGTIYAAGATTLMRFDGASSFARVELGSTAPITDLYATSTGVLVARATRVEVVGPAGRTATIDIPTSTAAPIIAVADTGTELFAATSDRIYRAELRDGATGALFRDTPSGIRDLALLDGVLYAATADGIARHPIAPNAASLTDLRAPSDLLDDDVRALAIASDQATLLAATSLGFARITGTESIKVGVGRDQLPNEDLRAIAESSDGSVITGHGIGATVLGGDGKKDHYHSLRWILDQTVTAVAIEPDRTRWIATSQGITRIHYAPTTLAAKAEYNESLMGRYWRMDGFVDDAVGFEDPWNQTGTPITDDNDNDGLWTEMQIGAWCLAYAVTKDERFYESARRAMDVMMMEFDIPAITFTAAGRRAGFITRSLVRDDEGGVYESKMTQNNWHRQEYEGRTYYWKDDTSSDEYAGHYFGIPLFYDLCAKTEAEREELRARIRSSTDYLIDNGYLLIDLDGMETTHGHWNDLGAASDGLDACTAKYGFDVATCVESHHGGGWLNTLEILGHLLAAWHMTGDQKYYDEYERLYTVERYGKMIPIGEHTFTVAAPRFANHSDHELAMLAYYTLLRYEPNEARRAIVVKSILDVYEYEREEHNPWQVATIASAHGEDVDLDGAIQSLKDLPTDWRTVRYDNSHRQDAELEVLDRHNRPQFDRVFPYDELRTMKWNGNPYAVEGGGNPREVLVPTPYLIAYWMARYHGLIAGP